MNPVLEIISPGLGVTIQDLGRRGWKRYGIPHGGAMDRHSLQVANRLAGNEASAPALEWMMHGGKVRLLRDARVAVAGGGSIASQLTAWRSEHLAAGTIIELRPSPFGLWSYLAIEGGIAEPSLFGSASAYPRAGMGQILGSGDQLFCDSKVSPYLLSDWPGGRLATWDEQRNFGELPALRMWPGPQRDWFPAAAWMTLLDTKWTISPRSDRTGFRLAGSQIPAAGREMLSEPVVTGSIQIPPGGEPIVTMRDGPTVGGYPKIAIVDDKSLDWLAQAAPGVCFRFKAL